ncbi:hypothetical protein QJU23_10725, partial [Pasteurella atlantica]
NDEITVSTLGTVTNTISGGAGIDTLKLDYSKTPEYSNNLGLEHYFYIGSEEKRLHNESSFSEISTTLAKNNIKHKYYNKYYRSNIGWSYNNIEDDLNIENQEIIGTQETDLFIHHKGYSSVFDGQKGTDTVYADLSDWTKSVTIKNGTMDVKQAEGNSLKFTNIERLLIKTGGGNDVIDNSKNSTNDYIDSGAGNDIINAGKGSDTVKAGSGNDEITVSTLGTVTNTISGGAGIDTLKLDYSKTPEYSNNLGLEHYFYIGSEEKRLHNESSFSEISTTLAKNNIKHKYYNKYYRSNIGWSYNNIEDDL